MGSGGTGKSYRLVMTITLYVEDYATGHELADKIVRRVQTEPEVEDADLGTTVNVNPVKPPGA